MAAGQPATSVAGQSGGAGRRRCSGVIFRGWGPVRGASFPGGIAVRIPVAALAFRSSFRIFRPASRVLRSSTVGVAKRIRAPCGLATIAVAERGGRARVRALMRFWPDQSTRILEMAGTRGFSQSQYNIRVIIGRWGTGFFARVSPRISPCRFPRPGSDRASCVPRETLRSV